MKINILTFGDCNSNWSIQNIDDGLYLTREGLFSRIRMPKIIDINSIKTVVRNNKTVFNLVENCTMRTNPKTYNTYLRVMKEKEKETIIPENVTILMFNKNYKFMDIDKVVSCIGEIISVFTDGEGNFGCVIPHSEGKNGKLFSGSAYVEIEGKIHKVTVRVDKGNVLSTDTVVKKIAEYERFKNPKTNTYVKQRIEVTCATPSTSAYIFTKDFENTVDYGCFDSLKEANSYNPNDIINVTITADGKDEKEILQLLESLRKDKYLAVTLSDDITITDNIKNSRFMKYIFVMDKNGNVRNIKSK